MPSFRQDVLNFYNEHAYSDEQDEFDGLPEYDDEVVEWVEVGQWWGVYTWWLVVTYCVYICAQRWFFMTTFEHLNLSHPIPSTPHPHPHPIPNPNPNPYTNTIQAMAEAWDPDDLMVPFEGYTPWATISYNTEDPTLKHSVSVEVDATADTCFRLFDDVLNWGEWFNNIHRVCVVLRWC